MTFDGPNKKIILASGTTSVSVPDLWSRWVDWFLTDDNSKYGPAMRSVGGDPIDVVAGTSIPVYTYMLSGWKVEPQSASHTLYVTDGILLVDGGGDPFVSPAGNYSIRICYQQPVQAIAFSSGGGGGGGGLTSDQATMLLELAQLQGNIRGVDLVVDEKTGRRYAGSVNQSVSTVNGVTTVRRI